MMSVVNAALILHVNHHPKFEPKENPPKELPKKTHPRNLAKLVKYLCSQLNCPLAYRCALKCYEAHVCDFMISVYISENMTIILRRKMLLYIMI